MWRDKERKNNIPHSEFYKFKKNILIYPSLHHTFQLGCISPICISVNGSFLSLLGTLQQNTKLAKVLWYFISCISGKCGGNLKQIVRKVTFKVKS